jgi:diguanylate cyclase (GGDEF)-like protein/putative nucleotidyltransferase with HDIG domain
MTGFSQLHGSARAYVIAVVLSGTAVVAHSIYRVLADPIDPQWVVIATLTLLTGSFSVKVASINARISVSETFVFVAVVLFGTAAGTITVLLEALVVLFWMSPAGRPPHRLLFNLAAPTVAIWTSANALFLLSPVTPYSHHPTSLPVLFVPLALFTGLYFLLNSWLVAIVVGLETKQSPSAIWWEKFTWLAVNYFSGASVAALIVTYMRDLNVRTLAVIVPLLVVSYLTFRTAMGRVEDSNHHLSELNRLHLSTIEALAMAIDAKDQITHGHIRRVQAYAVGLAKHLGVADEALLKAVEAAALLHDMGKLAVPEHILNKPGKLTAAEFEKMKLHATIGADILSSIHFPYPVVPIVRHHHENWDGTGYPARISGTDIPLGARILSVVDCFDALTSDRPYRSRLSDDDALAILRERRGTMYDPLIVDTFERVHVEIAPRSNTPSIFTHLLADGPAAAKVPPENEMATGSENHISSSADQMLTLYELARSLTGQASISDTGDVIATHLNRLIPSAQIVLFLYNHSSDELEVKYAFGDASSALKGICIPLGQRLSGWVAANRRTIVNSDPALDLGSAARTISPRLRSCLSTALVCDEQLVGVLTLYSEASEAYSDDHRRIFEGVAKHTARTFKHAAEFELTSRRDLLTGLPSARQLETLLAGKDANQLFIDVGTSLLLIKVDVQDINDTFGRNDGDDALLHVVSCARRGLRVADLLFRYSGDEFVALLNDTDPSAAEAVSVRIRGSLAEEKLTVGRERSMTVRTTVTCVSATRDRISFADLMTAAQLPCRFPTSQVAHAL